MTRQSHDTNLTADLTAWSREYRIPLSRGRHPGRSITSKLLTNHRLDYLKPAALS